MNDILLLIGANVGNRFNPLCIMSKYMSIDKIICDFDFDGF